MTVSQDAAGRWFVSVLCEDPGVKPLPTTDAAVGVDAGLDHLLTLSTGEKITNPRHERRDRARLARSGNWPVRPRGREPTGPRPAGGSPAFTPGSPTGGATPCIRSLLGSFVTTKRS
ncbi:hypothetical protein SSPO_098980 [Streptomyces antimycoticus]|uniref:Probable transposase IS891/IS1136/IS1341 domain-containing protein n=1 Tax=Streptomyces antimycoticus TaxID=68175 RepID=A0A499V2X9_9ACTN|nr:hypothetical protein SSPO_098980 [Streptomyces antimycoticus]